MPPQAAPHDPPPTRQQVEENLRGRKIALIQQAIEELIGPRGGMPLDPKIAEKLKQHLSAAIMGETFDVAQLRNLIHTEERYIADAIRAEEQRVTEEIRFMCQRVLDDEEELLQTDIEFRIPHPDEAGEWYRIMTLLEDGRLRHDGWFLRHEIRALAEQAAAMFLQGVTLGEEDGRALTWADLTAKEVVQNALDRMRAQVYGHRLPGTEDEVEQETTATITKFETPQAPRPKPPTFATTHAMPSPFKGRYT